MTLTVRPTIHITLDKEAAYNGGITNITGLNEGFDVVGFADASHSEVRSAYRLIFSRGGLILCEDSCWVPDRWDIKEAELFALLELLRDMLPIGPGNTHVF